MDRSPGRVEDADADVSNEPMEIVDDGDDEMYIDNEGDGSNILPAFWSFLLANEGTTNPIIHRFHANFFGTTIEWSESFLNNANHFSETAELEDDWTSPHNISNVNQELELMAIDCINHIIDDDVAMRSADESLMANRAPSSFIDDIAEHVMYLVTLILFREGVTDPNEDDIVNRFNDILETMNNAAADKGMSPDEIDACISVVIVDGELSKLSCPICLDDYKTHETVCKTSCEHLFHGDCLNTWLTKRITCPTCRHNLTAATTGSATVGSSQDGSTSEH